jgi:hypothetical protein
MASLMPARGLRAKATAKSMKLEELGAARNSDCLGAGCIVPKRAGRNAYGLRLVGQEL